MPKQYNKHENISLTQIRQLIKYLVYLWIKRVHYSQSQVTQGLPLYKNEQFTIMRLNTETVLIPMINCNGVPAYLIGTH